MKTVRSGLLGIILLLLLASCAKLGLSPAALEPFNAGQDNLTAVPTNPPPVPSHVSPASIPQICDCVLRFDRISIEQGLSQSSVHVAFQDSRGFMWFGTQDGLNRYDGYTFKTFKPDPDVSTSLSDRWITSIVEDKDGYMWVATGQGGLNRYDPHTEEFKRYKHDAQDPRSLSDNHVNVVYLDKDGKLWVGTQSGLDTLDRGADTFIHYVSSPSQQEGITGKSITAILQDSRGNLWIGTRAGGLNRFDQQSNQFTPYQSSPQINNTISNDSITALTEGPNNTIWVGTQNGLNRFEPETGNFERYFHSNKKEDSISHDSITALHVDSTGNLWVGTRNGLDRLTGGGTSFVHYRNDPTFIKSLSMDQILSIYEDRGGVLWFGTNGGGVNKYDRMRDDFAYYRHDPNNINSLSSNFISSILVDSEGFVWVGTFNDGLNRLTRSTNQVIHFRHSDSKPNGISSDEIISLAEDQDGILWVGTGNGLDRFDRTTLAIKHFLRKPDNPTSLSANRVYKVYVDSQNNVWVGTAAGLDRLDRSTNTFVRYSPQVENPTSISGAYVNSILEDSQGMFWVGTYDSGLNRFDPKTGKFIRYRNNPQDKTSISNDSILSIYEDTKGRIWIGTFGGGLNLYDPKADSFSYYLEKDGLANGVVYGILEDPRGNLWLSTNFGISRFNPETEVFRNFDEGDGLQSNEFNSYSYTKGKDGEFYFGGIDGLTVFQPVHISDSPYVPQVTLTSLTQDDKSIIVNSSVETVDGFTLQWPQNSFEFEFAALSYNQPNKNQYAYKLEGFDTNWHLIGTKRNGRYTNLPGGQYTLLLKSTNSDGVWSQSAKQIHVQVIPPFWQTPVFQVLIVVLTIGVVFVGFKLRTRNIQDRNRELERLVRERTGALEKRNQEIQALYEADERILRNVSLNQVFQTLVDVAVDMLNADSSIVFAWDEKQTKVVPRVSHGFSPETLKVLEFSKGEGAVGEVLTTGKSVIVRQIDLEAFRPDVQAALIREGIRSYVHLPIVVDHRVVGVFNVSFTRPNLIGDDTTRLFSALAHRASISIANMELFEQTKDLAVMEERNRLARDLHDSAKQKAFAALAQLGTAKGVLNANGNGNGNGNGHGHENGNGNGKENGNSANIHLSEAENLVSDVIQELTFLVQEIYPIALQENGLATTLREYIFEWENRNDIAMQFTTRDERRLPLEVEQAIYRVAQEALANVARHSQAKRVDVSLVYSDDSVQLSVSDNGCGFNINPKSQGMGLRSIRERVSSIHGTVQIQSAPGHGTRLLVQVPIKN
jgi:ligand-binding sensor domain-containing protein/signal transduction histidine kinase